jgi:hypothetical protein
LEHAKFKVLFVYVNLQRTPRGGYHVLSVFSPHKPHRLPRIKKTEREA